MRKESMYLYSAEYWCPNSRASFAPLLQFIYSILKVLRMVLSKTSSRFETRVVFVAHFLPKILLGGSRLLSLLIKPFFICFI